MTSLHEIDRDIGSAGGSERGLQASRTLRIVVSVFQLLAVALCFEVLLGTSDGAGTQLRLFLIVVVMVCIVLKLGWLMLVAIQFSLFLQEPGSWKVEFSPGTIWVIVATLTIVAAMKLPRTHRTVSDLLMGATEKEGIGPPSSFPMAMQFVQVLLAIGLASFMLPLLPIGPQTNGWLASSVRSGQAFWPGSFWLAMMVACFVLAREMAWRMISVSQASLYLRSVKLIGNYRDLARFERARRQQIRTNQMELNPPMPEKAKPPKLNNRTAKKKPDSKGKS